MRPVITIFVAAVLTWPFASDKNQPPKHPIIGNVYYCCDKCHTLAGGIWGKGPTRWFTGAGRNECVHLWKEVSRTEFKTLAVQLYGIDWSKEGHFWGWEEISAKALKNAQGHWIQMDTQPNAKPVRLSLTGIDFVWSDGVNKELRGRLDAELAAEGRRSFSTVCLGKQTKGFLEVKDDRLVVWLKSDDSIAFDKAPDQSYSRFQFRRE